ncbi:hypothetical protein F4778DRAFT_740231 [Xylariomycetidae sp. FL2044]|nr:hypothetical protein F4778DRAFT_740231 [Xylariomycetidae sp. FL2044]
MMAFFSFFFSFLLFLLLLPSPFLCPLLLTMRLSVGGALGVWGYEDWSGLKEEIHACTGKYVGTRYPALQRRRCKG